MSDFKVGDTVRQKGSPNQAPVMTINYYSPEDVRCTYWQQKEQLFITVKFHPAEPEKAI